jgi:hypothetical protein
MKEMEPPSLKPALDRGGAEPHGQQLRPGDHAVLALGQNRQTAVRPFTR